MQFIVLFGGFDIIWEWVVDDWYISDYVFMEVFDQQFEEFLEFLLEIVCCLWFCVLLCDMIWDCDDSQEILEMLLSQNFFFILLDMENCWFCYYDLF